MCVLQSFDELVGFGIGQFDDEQRRGGVGRFGELGRFAGAATAGRRQRRRAGLPFVDGHWRH